HNVYVLTVVIISQINEIRARKLMREFMFGIKDNLRPCTEFNESIYYKFLVKPYQEINYSNRLLKDFKAESIEFDDIEEFSNISENNWQKTVLTWIKSLELKKITYDYVVIIDEHTVINLKELQKTLDSFRDGNDSFVINDNTLTPKQKFNLVWGHFDIQTADDMLIILETFPNHISLAYYYFKDENPTNENNLFFINDQIEIIEWPNSVKYVPTEKTIGVGHVYLGSDVKDLIAHLSITQYKICHSIIRENGKLSIAIVTSSFIYNDMCMYPIAYNVTDNKRRYAKKHGYSFVPRSEEYYQQIYKEREKVWRKIDVIEKVLPHYDWVFWLDMDAVIANQNISIEQLFEKFKKKVGKGRFNDINFVIVRPRNDVMINAGVFLIKNSEWSENF
ncbi:3744_t:CDS:2, partial [Scutellospora calospora]